MLALDGDYWKSHGTSALSESLADLDRFNTRKAKNIILFIGDGMSIPTVTAGRIFKAQKYGKNFDNPESQKLAFESFPNVGLSMVSTHFQLCMLLQKFVTISS